LRISSAAGTEATATPITIAAIGSVARPGSDASCAPMIAPRAIDMTMAESISACAIARRSTLLRCAVSISCTMMGTYS
jgi:hypothetical protein